MELHLYKIPGLRNDLRLIIPHSEIRNIFFHIANREKLMNLPGLLRHTAEQDAEEKKKIAGCKIPVTEHLKLLTDKGCDLLNAEGSPKQRILAVGARNVGNNHGFAAWQKDEFPKLFHVQGDPLHYPAYSCLVFDENREMAIRCLHFSDDRVFENNKDVSEQIRWCVFGNQVLKKGRIVNTEDIIDQFYDIRHVLAFDRKTPDGFNTEREIYRDYPQKFRENALNALLNNGLPRNRFFHNAIGLSDEKIFILQKEGTVEEIAESLKHAGAEDGMILDNGGSVFCWAWWLNQEGPFPQAGPPKGGYLFTAPDFRQNSSAVIVFVLKGAVGTHLPGGSVAYSVL